MARWPYQGEASVRRNDGDPNPTSRSYVPTMRTTCPHIITAICGQAGHENAIRHREFRLDGDGAQRSDEVGPQRFTNDVGLVDTVTIGALLEQIRELVVQPGVDSG
jgi:hypothetical protein